MFLYKEDFNKFLAGLTETISFVKTDLMPDFDFDAFNHDQENEEGVLASVIEGETVGIPELAEVSAIASVGEGASVDEWKM